MIEAVRCSIEEYKDRWDEHLPQVCLAIRSSRNRTTGISPNRMMLGREINTPVNLMIPTKEQKAKEPEEYREFLEESLQKAHQLAREKLKTEIVRNKTYHDRRALLQEFKVGDIVLWMDKARMNKLHPLYLGPALLTHKLSPCNFRILVNNQTFKVVNHDMIKICRDRKVPEWIIWKREELLKEQRALYCICRKPDDGFLMIQCSKCLEWFHAACIGPENSKLKNNNCHKCQ